MRIEGIIWIQKIVEKLAVKHHVETYEVEEVFNDKPRFRFVLKKATERMKMFTWPLDKVRLVDI